MSFARFMELALYHPALGYYRHPRIGYGTGNDFFTATTSGPVFGELVCAACVKLLGKRNPHEHTFVEIGANSAGGVLAGVMHPFGHAKTVRLGDAFEFNGPCVVFSNELFDAQPFRRLRFRDCHWRELGVSVRDGALAEIELPRPESPLPSAFPERATEGYTIDVPLAAVALLETIACQKWVGSSRVDLQACKLEYSIVSPK